MIEDIGGHIRLVNDEEMYGDDYTKDIKFNIHEDEGSDKERRAKKEKYLEDRYEELLEIFSEPEMLRLLADYLRLRLWKKKEVEAEQSIDKDYDKFWVIKPMFYVVNDRYKIISGVKPIDILAWIANIYDQYDTQIGYVGISVFIIIILPEIKNLKELLKQINLYINHLNEIINSIEKNVQFDKNIIDNKYDFDKLNTKYQFHILVLSDISESKEGKEKEQRQKNLLHSVKAKLIDTKELNKKIFENWMKEEKEGLVP